nr:hypothetical protein [Tanacetum cinerariifolium]
MKAVDAKKAIQDMAGHSQNGTMECLLRLEDCPLKEKVKTFEEAYYTQFGVPFPQGGRYRAAALGFYQRDNGNPSYQERIQTMEESLSKLMVESTKLYHSRYAQNIKVPLILGRPFLSSAHAKIDVFKRKITLKVGDDKIMLKNNNPTNSKIRRVYVLGLRETMELDLEARLMREALILNRSLDHVYGD